MQPECRYITQSVQKMLLQILNQLRQPERNTQSPDPVLDLRHAKYLVIDTQGDIDSHVVKVSAKFKLTMDTEIGKLFYARNFPFSIRDHALSVCESNQDAQAWICFPSRKAVATFYWTQ